MNTKRLPLFILLFAALFSACASATESIADYKFSVEEEGSESWTSSPTQPPVAIEPNTEYIAPQPTRTSDLPFPGTVPTPVDDARRPDLDLLREACRTIAPRLREGAVVVLESTVYPGVTETFCAPILAEGSGLLPGRDFKLAYSPERSNPGDREHRLETIVKVVAAQDEETLDRVAALYELVTTAGVYRAPSIMVAED